MTAGTKRLLISKPVVKCSTERSRDPGTGIRDPAVPASVGCAIGSRTTDPGSRLDRTSDINLLVLSEHATQRIGDFAEGRSCFYGADHERNQIRCVARGDGQSVQRDLPLASV